MTTELPEDPSHRAELEQLLRDERARREHAEQALDRARSSTQVWRQRAEDRAARIRKLRQPRARLRAWLSRSSPEPAGGPPSTTELGVPRPTPAAPSAGMPDRGVLRPLRDRAFPAVKVIHATAADSPVRLLLEEFDSISVEDVGRGQADADLFVLEDAAVAQLGAEERDLLARWLTEPARSPSIRFVHGDVDRPMASSNSPGSPADLVVNLAVWSTAEGEPFLPWFDRARTQVRLPDPREPVTDLVPEPGLLVAHSAHGPLAAWQDGSLDLMQHPRAIALMASGIPVLTAPADAPSEGHVGSPPDLPSPWEFARTSVAQRRATHATATGAHRALELAQLAGVPVAARPQGVAAVLVSNRPDRVLNAVERALSQTVEGLELHVGLHGGGPQQLHADVRARADAAGVTVSIVDLPAQRTLGWCLNEVIAGCSAPAVAKIDDDDHYGPDHLLDAVQALDYAQADVTGKASYLAYVVEDDTTYLVNAGKEEVQAGAQALIGGSLVMRRSAWERCPFPDRPRRVDSLLLRAARAQGLRVYATSRFEFVYERRVEGHTWSAAPDRFRARAEVVAPGLDPDLYRAR